MSSSISKSFIIAGVALILSAAVLLPARTAHAVDEAAKYPITDGDGPVQNLTLANDGDFYGVAPYGYNYVSTAFTLAN